MCDFVSFNKMNTRFNCCWIQNVKISQFGNVMRGNTFRKYNKTGLQGTPQYQRNCPYMAGVPPVSAVQLINMGKIGLVSEF